MLNLIERHKTDIASICRRFHVRRLDVFGSAAGGDDFDAARSDVDLLVAYLPATSQESPGIRTCTMRSPIFLSGLSIWSWKAETEPYALGYVHGSGRRVRV